MIKHDDKKVIDTIHQFLGLEQYPENIIEIIENKIAELQETKLDMLGFYDEIEIETHYDEISNTRYYLAKIPKYDKYGELIKIKHSHTDDVYPNDKMKNTRKFSVSKSASVAINASPFSSTTGKLVGKYIKNGVVIQSDIGEVWNYVLGMKEDNTMKAFPPTTPATEIIRQGYINAITVFIPLIENGKSVSDDVINLRDIFLEPHPRSAIAQNDCGDTFFFVSEGRIIGQYGMFAKDVIRILLSHRMVFAQMLDGGGSSQLVRYHHNVNQVSGDMGAEERPVGNGLYVARKEVNQTANQVMSIIGDSTMEVYRIASHLNRLRYQRNNYIELEAYLINGWKNYGDQGSNRCRGWVMPNNTLYLVGTITGGELNKPFMKLPDEISPMFSTHHLVAGNEENEIYKVIVNSNGELQWYYWNTAGRPPNTEGPDYIKLDGIFVPLNTPLQGIQR